MAVNFLIILNTHLNNSFKKLFLSLGGAGFSKKAPGTLGSFLALVLIIIVKDLFPGQPIILFFIAIFLVSVLYLIAFNFINAVISAGDLDEPWIIIDEFIGMMIASLPFLINKNFNGWLLILGFALFRLLDIWKPSLIGKIDKLNNAHGVLLDDVVAGTVSAAILIAGSLFL